MGVVAVVVVAAAADVAVEFVGEVELVVAVEYGRGEADWVEACRDDAGEVGSSSTQDPFGERDATGEDDGAHGIAAGELDDEGLDVACLALALGSVRKSANSVESRLAPIHHSYTYHDTLQESCSTMALLNVAVPEYLYAELGTLREVVQLASDW